MYQAKCEQSLVLVVFVNITLVNIYGKYLPIQPLRLALYTNNTNTNTTFKFYKSSIVKETAINLSIMASKKPQMGPIKFSLGRRNCGFTAVSTDENAECDGQQRWFTCV
mmetsp:Transcript_2326/g.4552  ORF Transcript_2326/g.4552 Transcript_2326/m.4552 type:complete len:109 (-) Transcript_2326:2256-2582(-)